MFVVCRYLAATSCTGSLTLTADFTARTAAATSVNPTGEVQLWSHDTVCNDCDMYLAMTPIQQFHS
jgi:hypothetical protein